MGVNPLFIFMGREGTKERKHGRQVAKSRFGGSDNSGKHVSLLKAVLLSGADPLDCVCIVKAVRRA